MRFFLSIYKGFPLWQFSFNFFKYLEELVVSFNYQTGLHTGAGQSFRIGCWYFFKKHMLYQTTDTNQNLICRYFSCYLFVNLWYLVTSLQYLSWVMVYYFPVLCYVGALRLLLWLKSKKHKESVSLPSLMENYQKSYTVHNFWVNGCKLQDWTRESLKMVLSMED